MKTKFTLLLLIIFLITNNTSFAQTNWVRDVANPILTGDSTAIQHMADPSVIYDNGIYRMWCGCVEANPSFASVCYSESADGTNWTAPIVVFSPNLLSNAWDNMKTEIPTVIKDTTEIDSNKLYKMWYGGADSLKPDSTMMGYAYSPDGQNWTRVPAAMSPFGKDGLVMVAGFSVGDAGVISDPTAIKTGSTYHVWYNSFGSLNDVLISHATSLDGYNWTKDGANPVLVPTVPWENFGPTGITADLVQPTVMIRPSIGDFLLCYGSFDSTAFERYDGFGYATSNDGSNWTKDITNPFFLPDTLKPGEEIGIHASVIVYVSGIYHMFYGGINNFGIRNILHATASDDALSIIEQGNQVNVEIHPNPTSHQLIIKYGKSNIDKIEIIDITGKTVKIDDLTTNVINVSSLTKGIYFIKIVIGQKIITKKFVKK